MNKIIILFISTLLFGCSTGNPPTKDEIAGTWVSSEGAILELNKDGKFIGKLLPGILINKGYKDKKYDAIGTWTINNNSKSYDQLPWEVNLNYIHTSGLDYDGTSSLLLSGANFLENKAPWNYLFIWQEEEGGERYKFKR